MKPIAKALAVEPDPIVVLAELRKKLLSNFSDINKPLAEFIMALPEIEDPQMMREVTLRVVAQLSHLSNMTVQIGAMSGVQEHEARRAIALGSKTADDLIQKVKKEMEAAS